VLGRVVEGSASTQCLVNTAQLGNRAGNDHETERGAARNLGYKYKGRRSTRLLCGRRTGTSGNQREAGPADVFVAGRQPLSPRDGMQQGWSCMQSCERQGAAVRLHEQNAAISEPLAAKLHARRRVSHQ
jgi:hypothetical protein